MNNAVPPLLALLLVCSLPAMAVVAAGPGGSVDSVDASSGVETQTELNAPVAIAEPSDTVNATNTTNRLPLGGAVESSYAPSKADFGTVLAIGDDRLRTDHEAFTFEASFDNMSTAERQEAIDTELQRVDDEIGELRAREHEAVRQHADGERADHQLLQVLARTTADAAELESKLDELNTYANEAGHSIETRPQKGELDVFQGPVREHVAVTVRGDGTTSQSETDIAIQTSETGVSLSLIERNEYVRETNRYDHRDTSAPDQVGSYSNASSRIQTLYPWTTDVSSSSHGSEFINRQLYIMRMPHAHGEIEIFLDGGTGAVYHEVQVLSLNQLPIELEETWTNESVELTANQTPANGPIEVSVTDEETGDPIDATISVDETIVGETDVDGSLWVIPPHGDYELSAQTSNTTVTAELTG